MDDPAEAHWLLFGLTPDQWTQINGLASTITAIAAVIGVVLATVAVYVSHRGVRAGLESTALERRSFLNDQLSAMLSEVFAFGAKVNLVALSLPVDGTENPRNIDSVRTELLSLYAAMNTTKLRIRSLESLGLGDLDALRRKKNGELTLDVVLRALEAIVDERYVAADWDSSTNENRADHLRAFPVGATGREVLGETVDFFMSGLSPIDQTVEVREALQDALEWLWVWELDEPWRVGRSEYARLVFDMIVDLTQECYAISAHSVATWSTEVPAPKRGWTCRCGIQNADHSSGLCLPKDKRVEFPKPALTSRG